MCMCVCLRVRVPMCVRVRVCVCMCAPACLLVCLRCAHVCASVCAYVYACVIMCVCDCEYMNVRHVCMMRVCDVCKCMDTTIDTIAMSLKAPARSASKAQRSKLGKPCCQSARFLPILRIMHARVPALHFHQSRFSHGRTVLSEHSLA